MKNLRNTFNAKGLTLIELLVSLALISIVIVTFLSFFSQSVLFSSKAEDKLTAVNIAEKVITELKANEDLLLDLNNLESNCKEGSHPEFKKLKVDCEEIPSNSEIHSFLIEPQTLNNKVYYPHVKVSTSTTEWDLNLWQVHVKIFTEEGQDYNDPNPVTELLSYLDSDLELGD